MTFRKKVGLGGLLLLTLLCVFAVVSHFRAKGRLKAYYAELAASGEKVTIADLTPVFPYDSNGAPTVLKISGALKLAEFTPPMMSMIAPGVARVAWDQPDLSIDSSSASFKGKTNVWEALAGAVDGREAELAELRSTLTNSAFYFSLDYQQGFTLLLPHLAPLKKVEQQLVSAMMFDLHRQQHDLAMANLMAAVALPRIYTNEPLMISQMVRFALESIAIHATWEALQFDGWSEAQLAALQKNWEGIETLGDIQSALRMERAMGTSYFDRIRLHGYSSTMSLTPPPTSLIDSLSEFTEGAVENPGEALRTAVNKTVLWQFWKYIWSYDDEIEYSEFFRRTIRSIDTATRNENFGPVIEEQRVYTEDNEENYFDFMDEPNWAMGLGRMPRFWMGKFVIRGTNTRTIQQIAVTAIALKRYRLKHGRYPQGLENLVPDYLSELPRDYFDGQTLRYKLQPDGNFLLYSVGEDLKDDGGEPTTKNGKLHWRQGLDLVWPRAATPSEVTASPLATISED
ncbi:MAG: hypothetical protein H0X66_08650 [Verrucomicrobia bacterium]|nr:hypothetical protein [Verrucomicrobiota bacterium]